MRIVSLLLIGLVVSTPLAAANKPAWAWTLEERIAARADRDLARERVRAARRVQTTNVIPNDDSRRWVDEFTGQTHPELFLPHEIFRTLITLSYLGSQRGNHLFRSGLMSDVARHGLPADFWSRLESLSAPYIADSWAVQDAGKSLSTLTGPARAKTQKYLASRQLDACRSRADALAAARREFGAERLDRYLYEVIAPNKFHAEDSLPDPKILRYVEGGCR